MEDRAISLNAVKDILKMANMEEFDIVAYRNIMQLPPVTSKDVPDNNVGKCEDAISRREAIKIFTYNYKGERIPDYDCDNFPVQIAIKKVKKMLRELPPVKPQTGHWKEHNNPYDIDGTYYCYCDNCWGDAHEMTDFCPNCGAKMEVEE